MAADAIVPSAGGLLPAGWQPAPGTACETDCLQGGKELTPQLQSLMGTGSSVMQCFPSRIHA